MVWRTSGRISQEESGTDLREQQYPENRAGRFAYCGESRTGGRRPLWSVAHVMCYQLGGLGRIERGGWLGCFVGLLLCMVAKRFCREEG